MKKMLALMLAATMFLMAFAGLASAETVIKVFSNLPDRTTGQGFVEQTLFDAFVEANPDVKIEVEALQDEPYKIKFSAYAQGTEMPDLLMVWGMPGFLDEVIDAGILAALPPNLGDELGFIPGTLDGFSKNGTLYGLARNTDVMAFYYNQKMFEDNGWAVPTTYEELLTLGETIAAAGVMPVSMAGGDKWPLGIYFTDLLVKIGGPGVNGRIYDAVAAKDFNTPEFLEAAGLMRLAAERGLFQMGFETADYGTAKNLFTNGQAAMFYMGGWEMSMATDPDIAPEVRDNIRMFTMPVVAGGKGTPTGIAAWNGGGYGVSANGAQRDKAIELLTFMFQPEGWTKIAWENGVTMTAQDFSAFGTGNETPVQIQFTEAFTTATSVSGTPIIDMGTANFKNVSEDAMQEVAIGVLTPEAFVQKLADGCR